MATTKKSTKAKIKKPIKKSPTKTSASKSVSTKKQSIKAPARIITLPKKTSVDTLTKLNIISAFISVALAVAAGLLMSSVSYELVVNHLAKNELAGVGQNALVPAVEHFADVELRWVVVATMLLGAILPILYLTIYKNRYRQAIQDKVNKCRWIDIGIISALMMSVVAIVSGIQDLITIKIIGVMMILTAGLGWVVEKRNKQAERPVYSEFLISVVTGSIPWLIIAVYALSTWMYGQITSPSYIYLVSIGLFVGFILYALNLAKFVMRKASSTNYMVVEQKYLIIGIIIKVIFTATLIFGFYK